MDTFVLVTFSGYLALGAAAVGLTGALGLQCSGEARTSVTTLVARIGPKGTSAENSLYLSEVKVTVTLSLLGTCWTVTPIFISGPGRARGVTVAPSRKKRTRLRESTDAQHMQKRAKLARPFAARKMGRLRGMFLALGAAAVGLTGALGLQCSGEARTSVTTLSLQIRYIDDFMILAPSTGGRWRSYEKIGLNLSCPQDGAVTGKVIEGALADHCRL